VAKVQTQKQDKSRIRSLMSNVVGAGAAVAVAVIALSSSVEAYFHELFVFEDKIFYNIEVVEIYDPEEGEPQNLPVRLVIQDQFGVEFIELPYGQTYGEVKNLKPNNLYDFKIQLRKDAGWITLTTAAVSTYPDLSGAVYEVSTNMDFLSNTTDLIFGVYTQQGIENISEMYIEIIVDGVIYKKDVTLGDQKVTIENYRITNRAVNVKLFAQKEGGALVTLHEKEFRFRPFINASFSFNYTSIETLELKSELRDDNFKYFVSIFKDDVFVRTLEITSSSMMIQVIPYSNYNFTIRAEQRRVIYDLISFNLETKAPPFSITQIYNYTNDSELMVQVFALDSEVYGAPYIFIDGVKTSLELKHQNNDSFIFTLQIPKDLKSFIIYLEILNQPNIEYTLDRIGD
jgi:hypothetical protein